MGAAWLRHDSDQRASCRPSSAADLRVGAAARRGAHIHQQRAAVVLQQCRQLVHGAAAVTHSADRQRLFSLLRGGARVRHAACSKGHRVAAVERRQRRRRWRGRERSGWRAAVPHPTLAPQLTECSGPAGTGQSESGALSTCAGLGRTPVVLHCLLQSGVIAAARNSALCFRMGQAVPICTTQLAARPIAAGIALALESLHHRRTAKPLPTAVRQGPQCSARCRHSALPAPMYLGENIAPDAW